MRFLASLVVMQMQVDDATGGTGGRYVPRNFPSTLADANWCGASFDGGLLRIHDSVTGPEYAELVHLAFGDQLSVEADVIAYDWSGRQFVVDRPRKVLRRGAPLVFGADPATGNVDEVASVDEFLAFLQLPNVGEAMQENVFRAALAAHGITSLAFDQVIGMRTPMFFGGQDTIDNTEVIDASVYWTLNAQLIRQGRTGRPIGSVVVDE